MVVTSWFQLKPSKAMAPPSWLSAKSEWAPRPKPTTPPATPAKLPLCVPPPLSSSRLLLDCTTPLLCSRLLIVLVLPPAVLCSMPALLKTPALPLQASIVLLPCRSNRAPSRLLIVPPPPPPSSRLK